MSEATYYVLASLLDDRLQGYAIVKKAALLSGGAVKLTTGTLYGALDRLVGQGLVVADGEEEVDGRLRRYYRLSDAGADAVRDEAARMRRAARAVEPRALRAASTGGAR
jgi:PadR family transcriptional regulator, regulatory protein PadR